MGIRKHLPVARDRLFYENTDTLLLVVSQADLKGDLKEIGAKFL